MQRKVGVLASIFYGKKCCPPAFVGVPTVFFGVDRGEEAGGQMEIHDEAFFFVGLTPPPVAGTTRGGGGGMFRA